MTDAREIIALELARISKIDMSEAPPYARASIHTAALHIERALTAAGFRIIGPDEVDPVTLERAAALCLAASVEATNPSRACQADELGEAIRALGRKT